MPAPSFRPWYRWIQPLLGGGLYTGHGAGLIEFRGPARDRRTKAPFRSSRKRWDCLEIKGRAPLRVS
jgi:hypothetical protein